MQTNLALQQMEVKQHDLELPVEFMPSPMQESDFLQSKWIGNKHQKVSMYLKLIEETKFYAAKGKEKINLRSLTTQSHGQSKCPLKLRSTEVPKEHYFKGDVSELQGFR